MREKGWMIREKSTQRGCTKVIIVKKRKNLVFPMKEIRFANVIGLLNI